MDIDAGDIVSHGPSGEEWVVAVTYGPDEIIPMGWPLTYAKTKDCTLVRKATPEERKSHLEKLSTNAGTNDPRVINANRILRDEYK